MHVFDGKKLNVHFLNSLFSGIAGFYPLEIWIVDCGMWIIQIPRQFEVLWKHHLNLQNAIYSACLIRNLLYSILFAKRSGPPGFGRARRDSRVPLLRSL